MSCLTGLMKIFSLLFSNLRNRLTKRASVGRMTEEHKLNEYGINLQESIKKGRELFNNLGRPTRVVAPMHGRWI